MLHLDASTFVGRGLHRECHRHPDDPRLCVKVNIGHDPHDTSREGRFYRHLERRGISWECVPRSFGPLATNLGPGVSFELIQDAPGVVSRTLQHYLDDLEASEHYSRQLCQGLQTLRQTMLRDGIVTLALRPKNIVCRRDGEDALHLYVVDSIGNTDFIPLCSFSSFFARRKVARKWERFEHSLLLRYPHNPFLARILGRLPLTTPVPAARMAQQVSTALRGGHAALVDQPAGLPPS